MTTLDQLKHTRRQLIGVETKAAIAVQREQKNVERAKFEVRERERSVEDARDRATLDAAEIELVNATKEHTLATKRLADRQGEHAYAHLNAAAEHATVVRAVDELLNEERETLAHSCISMYEQLELMIAGLRAVVPDELNTPRHLVGTISATVTRALNLLPPLNWTQVPVNILQFGAHIDAQVWGARRSRLIADDETTEETAAA